MSDPVLGSLASPAAPAEPAAAPRVLAVDDQPDSLQLLRRRLQAGGIECVTCSDGAAVPGLLERETVDVIILDVVMPGVDGYEVCRRLKANERTADIPVLFLTSNSDPEDRIQGLEIGGHDYLTKPVQQQELLARTRAAVRVKRLQDQLKRQIQLQEQIHCLHRGMLSEHWQKTFGQLAASLAHEINNPLAAALGTTQLLRLHKGLNQEVLESLQVIDQSLQRAAQKLRSLLLIAQAGQPSQKLSVARLIDDVLALVNYQLVMNRVTVKSELDPTCQWEGVSSALARALLFILNNALEAVASVPDPTIRLRLDRGDPGLRIRVADNGPGVPEAIRHQIFEPFFSTKGDTHHGIGLYLAAEIVRPFGGHIELLSPAEPPGAEFSIGLPVSRTGA